MKSTLRVVVSILFLGLVSTFSARAADDRSALKAELDKLKADLKPLREQAYLEKDVIEARKALDAAYRDYWEAVRAAMARIDATKADLIAREQELRDKLNPKGASRGSRAEDYEKKAAEKSSAAE